MTVIDDEEQEWDDAWDDEEYLDEEEESNFDELELIERRQYIEGIMPKNKYEIDYDYSADDYPYGFDLDV